MKPTRTRTLTLALLASGAIVGAALAPVALARGPQGPHSRGGPHAQQRMMERLDEGTIELARQLAEEMGAVRESAFETIRASASTANESIKALREKGAPEEALRLAATQARDAIGAAVLDADAQIVAIASAKVAELRAGGASTQQLMAVLRVRDRSLQALHQGAMRGQMSVARGVRGALKGDEGDNLDAPGAPGAPGTPGGPRGPRHQRGPALDDGDNTHPGVPGTPRGRGPARFDR